MYFNPNTVERTTYELLPDGWYGLQVNKIERIWKEENNSFSIKAEIEVGFGEFQGRKIFESFNLQHPNEKAEKIGREGLASLCDAIEVSHMFQGDGIDLEQIEDHEITEMFCFKPFTGKVRVQKDKTGNYSDQNRIREYKVFDQNALASGPNRGSPPPRQQQPVQQSRPQQPQGRTVQQQGNARPSQGGNSGMPWDRAAGAAR